MIALMNAASRSVISSMILGLASVIGLAACGGSAQQAAASMPQVGQEAPALMLQDHTGRVRTLAEHRGHPVVLYFYPRDATPGCTQEACAFRDAWDRLQAAGAVVLGVSTDDVISHQRFRDEHNLPFDLLSDPDETAARAYGVPVRMGFTSRVTFLIDGSGQVARVWPDVDPGVHCDEVLAAIGELPAAAH
jgi:peroxiredoxin Q/BCP